MLHELIEQILPTIIALIELIGIFVVTAGTFKAFGYYILNLVQHRQYPVKHHLAQSMATGLDFKMAAEILKTVLITNLNELLILGSIILLRALLAFMIHAEMKSEMEHQQQMV